MTDRNRELPDKGSGLLHPLLDELVFVGGAVQVYWLPIPPPVNRVS